MACLSIDLWLPLAKISYIDRLMTKSFNTIRNAIVRDLLSWYDEAKRPLPWRETSDPYRIWISEIMLQQTQVDTVIPYYHRFLEAFPTVDDLARAPFQDVLKRWENLGYYSRARNLHAAAAIIVTQFGGAVPSDLQSLRKLPGIGPYTAGAILSIAFGQAVPAVDGNIRRILCRLFAMQDAINHPRMVKRLQQTAADLVPPKRPGDYHQALMDLGATVCRAKDPACLICPLRVHCRSQRMNLQNIIPASPPRSPLPHREAVAAIIRDRSGRVLMVQRPASGLLASLWSFPGGFLQDSNDRAITLKQFVQEALDIRIRVGLPLASVNHAYTHFRTTLYAYDARITKGASRSLTTGNWLWASPETLQDLPLAKIDRMIAKIVFEKEKN